MKTALQFVCGVLICLGIFFAGFTLGNDHDVKTTATAMCYEKGYLMEKVIDGVRYCTNIPGHSNYRAIPLELLYDVPAKAE